MDIFNRKINFDALFKFSHITPSTQQHLKKVYASFALCMFVAAAGAYVHVVTHFTQAGLLSALGSLGLMIWLMATPHSHETEQKRLGLLAGSAFLTGVFDTQLTIEKAENGDKDYIWHCVDLFLDFVTLFRKLMMILAMSEKDKKKKK
ncbi:hypothetical protein G4228_020566 [Cervus hanglu yarkandensis]|uniref:Bax inhibitor 1 n=1 Tax=Cervus hanglu yarkandensis TaxID=84702 RepID=A0A833WH79_9CERV|nr:hypothetical protein G4228_020566 [Cervus hanglu yarkandensis]